MSVRSIAIGIDPSKATAGAKVVKRDLESIGQEAKKTENSVKQTGSELGRFGKNSSVANDNVRKFTDGLRLSQTHLMQIKLALVAAGAALLGAFAGAASLQKFISSTAEAQQAQTQLAAALKSTGGVSGQTISSLNDNAAALQRLTTTGDDTVNVVQALLLTFTRIRGDVFPQATKVVLNLAQAMGGDLKGASLQVGKALNDPVAGIAALSRSGIQFTDSQEKMIKKLMQSGQILEAQTIILKELETQFGGSAEAARGNLGGALTALGNSWGDLFELSSSTTETLRLAIESLIVAISSPAFVSFVQLIGATLVAGLASAVQALTLFSNALTLIMENLDTLAVAAGATATILLAAFAGNVVVAVVNLIALIGTGLVGAVLALNAAILANPIGALAAAFVAAVTAAYYFRDEIQKTIGVDVVETARTAANYLIGSFVAAYEDLKFVWSNFGDIMGAAVIGGVNLAITAINNLVNGAKMSINDLINMANALPGIDMQTFDANKDTISLIDNPSVDRLAGAVEERNRLVSDALNADYLGGLTTSGTNSTPGAAPAATGNVVPFTDVASGGSGKKDKQVESYQKLIESSNQFIAQQELERQALGMTEEAANALRYEQDLLNKAANDNIKLTPQQTNELKALAAEMASAEAETNRLKEAFDFAKDSVKGFLSDFRSGLQSGQSVWEAFGNAALNVLNKIIDKLETQFVDALFSANSAMGSGGNWLGSLFSGIFGGGGTSQWGLAQSGAITGLFASGTSYAPGGDAIVGENGPERIRLPRGSQVYPAGQSGGASNDNRSHVEVSSSVAVRFVKDGTFEAYVEETASKVSRKTTEAGLSAYTKRMPDIISRAKRNPDKR